MISDRIQLNYLMTTVDFTPIIAANQRAKHRGKTITNAQLNIFKTIFNVETLSNNGTYGAKVKLTLKDEFRDLTLKQLLQICQQFIQSENSNQRYGVIIPINGKDYEFIMRRDHLHGGHQIIIETMHSGYESDTQESIKFRDSYESIIDTLDHSNTNENYEYSELILQNLFTPIREQTDDPALFSKPVIAQAIVSLTAITHVAEGCPGRSAGMDKLARASLRRIALKESNFNKEFNKINGRYFVARKGGTKLGRDSINSKKSPIENHSFDYLSDESDENDIKTLFESLPLE